LGDGRKNVEKVTKIMCGIASIIGKNASEERLDQMLLSQKHRGPDFTGKYIGSEIVLGHNRRKRGVDTL
jgi:asparagine synthetase B (glutamine-hydrolysing)